VFACCRDITVRGMLVIVRCVRKLRVALKRCIVQRSMIMIPLLTPSVTSFAK